MSLYEESQKFRAALSATGDRVGIGGNEAQMEELFDGAEELTMVRFGGGRAMEVSGPGPNMGNAYCVGLDCQKNRTLKRRIK